MPQRVDISGHRFGRLVAVKYSHTNSKKYAVWECVCDCGATHFATAKDLRSGNTTSCGCAKTEAGFKQMYKDGRTSERLHSVWYGMMTRCYNPKADSYKNYGARGIVVCDEWHDYPAFRKWALEHGYDENAPRGKCTIDRIENDGIYEPANCRFVGMDVQGKNKRHGNKPWQKTPVVQVDSRSGAGISRYAGAVEAGGIAGVDPSSIVKCCKGKLKTAGGFIWKHDTEEANNHDG